VSAGGQVKLELSEDGSGIGAALVAAAAHSSRPGGTTVKHAAGTAIFGKAKFLHI